MKREGDYQQDLLTASESDMAGQRTNADRIWNRAALKNGGTKPREGDRSLAAMLKMHNAIMNGGVRHAIESLSPDEIEAAVQGYQYFKLDGLVKIVSDFEWRSRDAADEQTDRDYYQIGEDSVLFNHFKEVLENRSEQFAPIDAME